MPIFHKYYNIQGLKKLKIFIIGTTLHFHFWNTISWGGEMNDEQFTKFGKFNTTDDVLKMFSSNGTHFNHFRLLLLFSFLTGISGFLFRCHIYLLLAKLLTQSSPKLFTTTDDGKWRPAPDIRIVVVVRRLTYQCNSLEH